MDNQEMENRKPEGEIENSKNDWKSWIQENMRVLLSVVIVIAIAGGVYSYSKRTLPENSSGNLEESQLALNEESEEYPEESEDQEEASQEPTVMEKKQIEEAQPEDRASSTATSQETEESFIETAGRGDGLTHLGRRALSNYLEKNPDSSLTAEHKIYIEDYLRKNVSYEKGVNVGSSVEFSKKLVEEAIQKSKSLNERQLQNLTQYAKRVPSLS